ncbi:MAG: C25 family cysteine peptidase [Chloroflexales bacterium]|nr:C25 family cysteine peptidase [Chloroflexales bacterium]
MTSTRKLAAYYGITGQTQVLTALDNLVHARLSRGIASLWYAPENGLPDLGVSSVSLETPELVRQLYLIQQAFQARGDKIESLLIVGGPRIFPFGRVVNPLPDQDDALASDCVYGLESAETCILEWPVGRLPDAVESTPRLLLGLLASAAEQHQHDAGPAENKALGYSAAIWQHISQRVYAEIGDASTLLVSPPVLATNLDQDQFVKVQVIYCNLHGVRHGPFWYGQASNELELLVALRPDDLIDRDLRGAVVFSQACYGAMIEDAQPNSSLALMFLDRGVRAFLGPTAISYGALVPPESESDLLALYFLRALRTNAKSIGAAFHIARIDVVRTLLQDQGFLDEDDIKTLQTFVLYGDPTLSALITVQE